MRIKYGISIMVGFLSIVLFSGELDESVEPPVKYNLEIDGKKYPIEQDKPIQPQIEVKNPKIVLWAEPYRLFEYGGVSFKYPRAFILWSNLAQPKIKIWTISGDNASIMVEKYMVKIEVKDFIEKLISSYGKRNCTTSSAKIKLDGKEVEGTRVWVKFKLTESTMQTMTQEIYEIRNVTGVTLLILQDCLDDDLKDTKEYLEMKKVFQESFSLK